MFTSLKAVCAFILAVGELDTIVSSLGGSTYFSKTSSCVNVHLLDGSFIATADYDTRMVNVQHCLEWCRNKAYDKYYSEQYAEDQAIRDMGVALSDLGW